MLGPWCAVPGCISKAQQRHHLWPKSFLRGQPYEWVSVAGKAEANSVGLCMRHHRMVTGAPGGHEAKVVYEIGTRILSWWEMEGDEWIRKGALKAEGLLSPEPEAARVRRSEGLCTGCGRPIPQPKNGKQLPKRKVKQWALSVPDDSEQGAEVLDTYIEDLGALMGLDTDSKRLLRYHVLAPVLEWVMQNRYEFLRDWEEARDA